MKVRMYDPPGGWRYGFPRPYKPLENESIGETLVRDGYPKGELDRDGNPYWCRFWDKEYEDVN
jgi:hypothetical protein